LNLAPTVDTWATVGSCAQIGRNVHLSGGVLGAKVVLTKSTRIIDVTGAEPVTYRGEVPPRSVVIPGSYSKKFPAGEYNVACALIIGQRKESTDKKVSLNDALRDYNVAV
jgi:2,3,4,5-tetrahydropyridine-2-carboxylate N-succinyltransferase